MGRIDRGALGAARSVHSPTLDRVMVGASTAANRSALWIGVAGAMAATGERKYRTAAASGLLGIGIAATLANGPLKFWWQRERPPAQRGRTPLLPLPRTFSFPSGHSASAFAFATGVSRALPAAAPAVLPMAAAVAYSRVYTGVHYPSDVLAGAGIGVASGLGAAALVRSRQSHAHQLTGPSLDVEVPRTAVLLSSPKAGSAEGGDQLDAVREALTSAGITITEEVGIDHLDRLASLQHDADGKLLILAAGGDGTVGAAAEAVVTEGAILGIIPLGTSNDVARSVGMPLDPVEAARAIANGRVVAVDAAKATTSDGESQVFVHAATLGLNVAFSEMATKGSIRDRFGGLTYPVSAAFAVRHYEPFRITVEVGPGAIGADTPEQSLDVVHLSVVNAPVFGGPLNMRGPDSSMTDGLLDVLLVGRLSLTRSVIAAVDSFFGGHRPVRRVQTMQVKSLTVHGDKEHEVAIDGEVGGALPVEFEVLPKALRIAVPALR